MVRNYTAVKQSQVRLQISYCSVSLPFLCDIPFGHTVEDFVSVCMSLCSHECLLQAHQGKKKKKELEKGKKAVKNLMNTIFHHSKDSKDSKAKSEVNENGASFGLIRRKSGSNSAMMMSHSSSHFLPPMGMPLSRFVRGC